ncbi:MAG: TonB-dependent receptor [Methylocystis sp.]|nr:MAG: TonB-dependent receptor [Methylocystis sp.]
MYRHHLLRGVSAGALTIVALSQLAEPAFAQQNLPTIDVGGQRRAARNAAGPARQPSGVPVASPSTAAAPVSSPAPSPVVSRWSPTLPDGRPAFVERWQLPNTVYSIDKKYIRDRVNIVDGQDALKYTPGIFVRKLRGGNEGMVQTRTWGLASARSMVFVDDLLISQLISNGHTDGQPRWGLISPEEIERVDVLYGPFAAQYAGNSIGGVIKYTTRMPEKLEVTAKQTVAVQDFAWWGANLTLPTTTTALTIGDKIGNFSYFVALNYAWNNNQPISFINAGRFYPFPGAIFSQNVYGSPQSIVGAGSISEENFINGKVKLAYDITPDIRATYTLGVFNSDRVSAPLNYLSGGRNEIFGPATGPAALPATTLQGFGAANLRYQETILTNALAVRSNTGGLFDFELSASHFTYPYSSSRSAWSASPSTTAAPFGGYTATGRDTIFTGTYWTLLDLKGIVRPPSGILQNHDISFGLHGDQYHSNNPVWLTTNWTAGMQTSLGVAQSIASGTTRTQALWVQDAIKLRPDLKFTVGVRGEHWQASDGYNQQSGVNATGNALTGTAATRLPIYQPNQYSTRFSPKGSLEWTPDDKWTIVGNIGLANRFPTVRELYNLTATPGATGFVTNPSPNLRPEVSLSKELAITRKLGPDGSVRLSLFDDEVRSAIISNATFVPGTLIQANANINVDRIRNSGFEIAGQKDNVFLKGLELFGSVDFVNSRIISFANFQPTPGNFEFPWATSVAGKNVPGVPKWRWNFGATFRPDDNWAFTAAMRWQDRIWRTVANNDIVHGIFGSSDRFFLVDIKAHYKYNERWSFDAGIDNVNNYKFALFHPFPQRTFIFSAKYEYGTGKGVPGLFFTGNEAGLPRLSEWFQPVGFSNWN